MTVQRLEAWVRVATPEEVAAATTAGELADVLAGKPDDPAAVAAFEAELAGRQKTEAWVKTATPEEVGAALTAGHLTRVLSGVTDADLVAQQAAADHTAAAEAALVRLQELTEAGVIRPDQVS